MIESGDVTPELEQKQATALVRRVTNTPPPKPKRRRPQEPEPAPQQEQRPPAYQRSKSRDYIRAFVGNAKGESMVAMFAMDAVEADRAQDDSWVKEAITETNDLLEYATRLCDAVKSADNAERFAGNEGRDDLSAELRAKLAGWRRDRLSSQVVAATVTIPVTAN